ncbi:MAG: trypsin-like peptidase domain-containing protein [Thermoanaerobaculia bacterium]|nr:trypsin-like peptidase domain-containing protein [Thermoanaerobaculia bacterium]
MRRADLRPSSLLACALLVAALPLAAAEAPLEIVRLPVERVAPPPLRLAEGLLAAPAASLRPAAEGAADQLDALVAWNLAGNLPRRDGFVRTLPEPFAVALGEGERAAAKGFAAHAGGRLGETLAGELGWGSWIHVAGAERLRLRLAGLQAPAGTRFWVWGRDGEGAAFGLELRDAGGTLWTPSVAGAELFLEAVLPAGTGAASWTVDAVAESFLLDEAGLPVRDGAGAAKAGECIRSATCYAEGQGFNAFADVTHAIAHLRFQSNGGTYVCTGALVNDSGVPGFIPYLLTAHHCISTGTEAASLEAWFDVRPDTCGGTIPGTFPKVNGATLLVTRSATDTTLLRLATAPPGPTRAYLGWTTATVASGTTLHRVSHPYVNGLYTQSYSRSTLSTTFGACTGAARPEYLYGIPNYGGTFGGSSGSPVLLPSGQIVGQLRGACGPNPEDGCDYRNADVDGAFSVAFPHLQPFLSPAPTGPCVRDATTACLLGGRFEVKVGWQTGVDAGTASVMSFGGQRAESDESVFWFFFDAANFEMGVKVLDACIPALGNRFWVFVSGLTNQGFTVTVRDTETGALRVYANPLGLYPQTVGDTDAFPCT